MNYKLLKGDCLEKLKLLPDNSVDSVVTDPPAGISFMGKEWDDDKGGKDQWINWLSSVFVEVKRVLKPGGHCLVWSLPRTSHWTGTALEDAGFTVRDCVYHTFGSGFPKSLNIGKAVDKKLGNEREVVGKSKGINTKSGVNYTIEGGYKVGEMDLTKGSSEWEGWGTGLKPAVECWWLVRKPISEKTIVDNVLKWGVGGINIDGCRIEITDKEEYDFNNNGASRLKKEEGEKTGQFDGGWKVDKSIRENNLGRFPSNFIHDGSEEVIEEFEKAGISKGNKPGNIRKGKSNFMMGGYVEEIGRTGYDDLGTPARFFYCSKPSTRERNTGCDELEENIQNDTSSNIRTYNDRCKNCGRKFIGSPETICQCDNPETDKTIYKQKNNHPTLKSVKLMSYLIKLITPKNGIVLDPFTGSGTTGISALLNNNRFIGIEMNEDYIKIAETRIKAFEKYRQFLK